MSYGSFGPAPFSTHLQKYVCPGEQKFSYGKKFEAEYQKGRRKAQMAYKDIEYHSMPQNMKW